jgi:hypothetical protein
MHVNILYWPTVSVENWFKKRLKNGGSLDEHVTAVALFHC